MTQSNKAKRAAWLATSVPSIVSAFFMTVQAHNLDDIASKVSSKSAVPIGGKFSLVDTAGKVVTEQSYAGKWRLIFFGFTTCPDVCATVMNEVATAMTELGQDATKIQPIFITMDPERDSARRMSEYLNSFDSRIVGLRGTDAQTRAAVSAFHVYSKKRESGSTYTLDHSAVLYLMRPDGSFGKLLSGDTGGHKLGIDLKTALNQVHEN